MDGSTYAPTRRSSPSTTNRHDKPAAFVALLEPGAATRSEALIEHCRSLLARFKVPRDLFILDSLPKNALGKIVKQPRRDLMSRQGIPTGRRCLTGHELITSGRRRWPRRAPSRPPARCLLLGTVDAVVYDTLHARPDDGSTHWTTRQMAAGFEIGKDAAARIWRRP